MYLANLQTDMNVQQGNVPSADLHLMYIIVQ